MRIDQRQYCDNIRQCSFCWRCFRRHWLWRFDSSGTAEGSIMSLYRRVKGVRTTTMWEVVGGRCAANCGRKEKHTDTKQELFCLRQLTRGRLPASKRRWANGATECFQQQETPSVICAHSSDRVCKQLSCSGSSRKCPQRCYRSVCLNIMMTLYMPHYFSLLICYLVTLLHTHCVCACVEENCSHLNCYWSSEQNFWCCNFYSSCCSTGYINLF